MSSPAHESMTMKTDVTGRGEPIVLVPGGLTGWRSWEPHATHLARTRLVVRTQLLCVDLGLSGKAPPADYSLDMESRALARSLDNLDIHKAHLVGWSYGGSIALDFALDHPDRVRSLTLIEPYAVWILRRLGRYGHDAQAAEELLGSLGPGTVSEDELARFLNAVSLVPPANDPRSLPQWPLWAEHRQSLRVGAAPLKHEDDAGRLENLKQPVLLFKGQGSDDYLREIVDLLARELPDASVEELPGGHALHLVAMEQFLTILDAFLAKA